MEHSALTYLKQELNFKSKEWLELPEDYKKWYREVVREECKILNIKLKD